MKQTLAQLQHWFDGLQRRERLLVGVGAVLVGITLLYLVLWEPIAKAHAHRETDLASARQLAQKIELLAVQSRSSPNPGINRSLSLLAAVDQSSKSGVLSKPLARIQPDGDTEVKVWLEAVPFDILIRWIDQMQTRDGIIVRSAQIEKDTTSGLVGAQLSLVRP